MNIIRKLICRLGFGLLVACAWSAPEFSGVLVSGGKTYLALRPEGAATIGWHQVGESPGGFHIVSYDDLRDTVVFSKAGASVEVRLKGARVESAPTVALVEQLARDGDVALQKLLPAAKTLEERRAKTATDLAALEARAASDPKISERIPEVRKRLKIEEDNVAYYLQQVIKSSPSRATP